jgi:hypothetical protein
MNELATSTILDQPTRKKKAYAMKNDWPQKHNFTELLVDDISGAL